MRYFDAWEKAADDGHVAHAIELRPGAEANVKASREAPAVERVLLDRVPLGRLTTCGRCARR